MKKKEKIEKKDVILNNEEFKALINNYRFENFKLLFSVNDEEHTIIIRSENDKFTYQLDDIVYHTLPALIKENDELLANESFKIIKINDSEDKQALYTANESLIFEATTFDNKKERKNSYKISFPAGKSTLISFIAVSMVFLTVFFFSLFRIIFVPDTKIEIILLVLSILIYALFMFPYYRFKIVIDEEKMQIPLLHSSINYDCIRTVFLKSIKKIEYTKEVTYEQKYLLLTLYNGEELFFNLSILSLKQFKNLISFIIYENNK